MQGIDLSLKSDEGNNSFLDNLSAVLLHTDWTARASAPAVSRAWKEALWANQEAHWKWMCMRLRDEHCLYVPDGLCPSADGWKAHFLKLWARRNLWKPAEAPSDAVEGGAQAAGREAETFSVSVAVRFRPAVETAGGAEAERGETIVMPLHQRVAMVRAKRGCSQAKAMRIVMKQEAAAKAASGGKSGDSWAVDADCVAVGDRPSAASLAALEAQQAAAAAAHQKAIEADAPAAAERARRRPHLLGRMRPRDDGAERDVAPVPANRVEAAIFDVSDGAAEAEAGPTTAAASEVGLVQVWPASRALAAPSFQGSTRLAPSFTLTGGRAALGNHRCRGRHPVRGAAARARLGRRAARPLSQCRGSSDCSHLPRCVCRVRDE